MIAFDVAYDKLASLETADEIADMMRGYGIKAIQSDSNSCAISKWMQIQTGMDVFTSTVDMKAVDHDRVTIRGTLRYHTNSMGEFIGRFDDGVYEDLVERGGWEY